MPTYSIRYHFSQPFGVPAADAYGWCTDYEPDDLTLMGEDGTRVVVRISDDAIILIDTFGDGSGTRKRKLVRLYPDRLSWTSTHLSGPNRYSQFLYEIASEAEEASRLDFTGLQVNHDAQKATPRRVAALASKLREGDSRAWRLLAKAMEKDLKAARAPSSPARRRHSRGGEPIADKAS